MEEIWVPVNGYEKYYQVSNFGNVRSLRDCPRLKLFQFHVMSQSVSQSGYMRIGLRGNDNKKKMFAVHRLVAMAFIENNNGYPHINHIDQNKQNNRVENLEWCTPSQNTRHMNKHKAVGTCVSQWTESGEFVAAYETISDASFATGIFSQNISQCANGQIKTSGGFVWKRLDENVSVCQVKRPVIQISIDGSVVAKHKTIADASRLTSVSRAQIRACCIGAKSCKLAGGYKWMFDLSLG